MPQGNPVPVFRQLLNIIKYDSGGWLRLDGASRCYMLKVMSEELTGLQQKVERLEELLKAAAGGEGALAERLDRLESWLEEISINNGEGRIGYLEKELQGYDLNDIEQGVEKLEKQLAELAESLADELEVIRREAKDYNKGLTEETADLSVGLEAVKETIDDQAKKIDDLSSKVEEESAEHEKQLTRGKTGLQEVRRDVSAADSQLRLLEQQQETQESQIDSLQRQLNQANAEIAQLQHAVGRPSLADQLLGCILGLTLIAGFGWLAFKLFQWIIGLIR